MAHIVRLANEWVKFPSLPDQTPEKRDPGIVFQNYALQLSVHACHCYLIALIIMTKKIINWQPDEEPPFIFHILNIFITA